MVMVPAFVGLGCPLLASRTCAARLFGLTRGHHPRPHRARGARVAHVPDPRRGRGRWLARFGGAPDTRPAGGRRRVRQRLAHAVPGRPARRAGRAARGWSRPPRWVPDWLAGLAVGFWKSHGRRSRASGGSSEALRAGNRAGRGGAAARAVEGGRRAREGVGAGKRRVGELMSSRRRAERGGGREGPLFELACPRERDPSGDFVRPQDGPDAESASTVDSARPAPPPCRPRPSSGS